MSGYFSFQGFDFKRVGRLWILAVLFLILIFSGYSVYKGVVSYKKDLSEGNEFKKIEAENFKKIQNYQHYSYSGVSYLFIPASSSIFFKNPEVFSGLTSKVNAISALEINKSGKGKSVCKGTSPLKMKFSELTFYIFCILAFLIGMEPTRSRDYLRLLSSEIAAWKLHIFNILPRFIVMITLFVIIYLLMLALPLLIGVDLSQIAITHLLVYLIAAMIIILFFAGLFLFRAIIKKNSNKNSSFVIKLRELKRNVIEGIKSIAKLKNKWNFIGHSLLIFILWLFMLYVIFLAFEPTKHLSLWTGIVTFLIGGLVMILPISGGIGIWHLAVSYTLVLYGVSLEDGEIFALIAHSTTNLIYLILGLIAYIWLFTLTGSIFKFSKSS